MNTTAEPVSRLQFIMLFWLLMLGSISSSSMVTLLPSVGRASNIPDALIVLAQALSAIACAVLANFWARVSLKHGRRRVMMIGVAGVALAGLLTGVSILIGVHHLLPPMLALLVLAIGRSTHGAIGLASVPAIQAYLIERTSRAQRTALVSKLASAQALGTVAGPAVAPFLVFLPVTGMASPMFLVAMLGILSLPFLALTIPPSPPANAVRAVEMAPIESLWRMPAIRRYLIFSGLLGLAVAAGLQTIGFLVIDVVRLSPLQAQPMVGGAILAGAVATILVQLVLVPWWKPSPRLLMLTGTALAFAGLIALAITRSYALIVIATVVTNIGYAAARPGVTTASSLALPIERQSEIAGAMLGLLSIALVVGPVLGVTTYTLWHPLPFLLLAILMAAAFGIIWRSRPPEQRDSRATEIDMTPPVPNL